MPIKSLGDKKYHIRVSLQINGRRKELNKRVRLDTKGQAKAIEKDLLHILTIEKEKVESEDKRHTFKKALMSYLDFSEDFLKTSTWYDRKTSLEAHTKELYEFELSEISKNEIKALVDNLKGSVSHKKKVLKHIKQVFKYAIDERKVQNNPCNGLRIAGDKNHKEKANKLTAMTKSEIDRLLSFLKDPDEHPWYCVFYVTYQLGLRSSEAYALEYEDINWEKKQVVISKSWCKRKNDFVPPKNGSSRILPMNDQLITYLRKTGLTNGHKGFVLPRFQALRNGNMTKILHEIQTHLGISKTNFHSIRASFITHLLMENIAVVKVQAMVGHNDLATTQRYIRLGATDLDGITNVLSINHEPSGKLLSLPKKQDSI